MSETTQNGGEDLAQTAEAAEAVEETSHSVLGLKLDIDFPAYIPDWLEPAWEVLLRYPLLSFIVIASAGYLLGKGLQIVVRRGLDRLISAHHPDFDERLIKYLTLPLMQVVLALFLVIASITLDLPDEAEKNLIRIIFSVLIFFWARSWFRVTHFILDTLSRHERHGKVFHVRTLPLYRMGLKLFLLGAFVWLFMAVWGINATAWLASAGILGIIVGFAARDTLANLISGVSIVGDAPYKIGDYIVLDSGERGIVMNLGLRSTRILTRDDVEVSIPNAVIGNAKILNESGGPWVKHRIRVPLGVAYSSDMDHVVEVLKGIAGENELMLEHPAPRVRLRGFGDNSIDMDFMGWIDRPEDRGRTVHQLLMAIIRRFREEGIEIPFPQRDLHFRDGSQPEAQSLLAGDPDAADSGSESPPENETGKPA
ncbi:MAG: mechanosensitive ion channel family protein [Xanthomonadales bacterium]|nr:mechanosensitive ion channel family protein [Xanthomonadales bacterium]